MSYIDCYLVPVSRKNKTLYESMASRAADVLRELGAMKVTDAWMDESGPAAASYHGDSTAPEETRFGSFPSVAGVAPGELLAVSWVEWSSRQARDDGMKAFTADPRVQFQDEEPAFEGARLIAGGFAQMNYPKP
jgi:uncharacterized protein YbaA (DUF1428 family)